MMPMLTTFNCLLFGAQINLEFKMGGKVQLGIPTCQYVVRVMSPGWCAPVHRAVYLPGNRGTHRTPPSFLCNRTDGPSRPLPRTTAPPSPRRSNPRPAVVCPWAVPGTLIARPNPTPPPYLCPLASYNALRVGGIWGCIFVSRSHFVCLFEAPLSLTFFSGPLRCKMG